MPLTITGLSQADFPLYGGQEFTITVAGGLVLGSHYLVYLGVNGTTADSLCYSGTMGNGYVCHPDSATEMRAVSPPLERTASLILTIAGANTGTYPGLRAVEQMMADMIFDVRRHWPAWLEAGPRSLDRMRRQDV